MRDNWRFIGYTIQAVTILLGIKITYDGHTLVGLLLSMGSLLSDLGLSSARKNASKTLIKLLLFVSGLLLWLVLISTSGLPSDGTNVGHASRDTRTRQTHKILHYPPLNQIYTHSDSRRKNAKRERETAATMHMDNVGTKEKVPRKRDLQSEIESLSEVNSNSISLLSKVFGNLPTSEFGDLRYRKTKEVRGQLAQIFDELPSDGFLEGFKNPCWKYHAALNLKLPKALSDLVPDDGESKLSVACLPYAYVLGQPKCGTSDLFERLKEHPEIR